MEKAKAEYKTKAKAEGKGNIAEIEFKHVSDVNSRLQNVKCSPLFVVLKSRPPRFMNIVFVFGRY